MGHSPIIQASREAYARARLEGFPPFLGGIEGSNPINATPYATTIKNFVSDFSDDEIRRALIEKITCSLEGARTSNVAVDMILIGGSFLDLGKENPKDLDAIYLYRLTSPDGDPGKAIEKIQNDGRKNRLDIRCFPLDADPLIAIKAVSYFTYLFAQTKRPDEKKKGLILLDCRDFPAPVDGGNAGQIS